MKLLAVRILLRVFQKKAKLTSEFKTPTDE